MKKGFTLIELLGVIVIMAVILLVTIPSVSSILKKYNDQRYTSFKNNLYLVSEAYLNDNIAEYEDIKTVGNFVYIYVDDLVESNYLRSTVVDPKTKVAVTDELFYTIKVTYETENKPYIYELFEEKIGYDSLGPVINITNLSSTTEFTLTDDFMLSGYSCTTSNIVEPTYVEVSGTSYAGVCGFASEGTYYLWAKDTSNNITIEPLVLTSNDFCAYLPGDIVKTFAYTGSVQEYSVPCTGTYKLEVWGAQGGSYVVTGGAGGYAYGNAYLLKSTNLYIVVGGAGNAASGTREVAVSGGYNGGGSGRTSGAYDKTWYCSSGGGATHIATATGILSSLSANKQSILMVGGGGGGGLYSNSGNAGAGVLPVYNFYGGAGGGLIGSNSVQINTAYGGTQTAGGSGGSGADGIFGAGGGVSSGAGSGGGGGLYGGEASYYYAAGAGGSGYLSSSLISGTTSMTSGSRSGNGYAQLTLVSLG